MIFLYSHFISYEAHFIQLRGDVLFACFHSNTEWLGLEGTSGDCLRQPPLLRQGWVEQVAQDHYQLRSAYLQGCRRHRLWGNCSSVWPPLTAKKCFLVFRWNSLCFHLCPLPLVLSLGTTEKTVDVDMDVYSQMVLIKVQRLFTQGENLNFYLGQTEFFLSKSACLCLFLNCSFFFFSSLPL